MKTGIRIPLLQAGVNVPFSGGEQANINGPSLVRMPEWAANALGPYHLYFASHIGRGIRLAYSDDLVGPYTLYGPNVLDLGDTRHQGHIASPDVHLIPESKLVVMYLHGIWGHDGSKALQCGSWATSRDGVRFKAQAELDKQNPAYLRVFEHDGLYYSTQFGTVARSRTMWGPFQLRDRPLFVKRNPESIVGTPRHTANLLRGDELTIFYSRYGDAPERIIASTVDISDPWEEWKPSDPMEVLAPSEAFEGADLPLEPSTIGYAPNAVHQVRDPAIYEQDGRVWLLYSTSGEQGIAMTEMLEP